MFPLQLFCRFLYIYHVHKLSTVVLFWRWPSSWKESVASFLPLPPHFARERTYVLIKSSVALFYFPTSVLLQTNYQKQCFCDSFSFIAFISNSMLLKVSRCFLLWDADYYNRDFILNYSYCAHLKHKTTRLFAPKFF